MKNLLLNFTGLVIPYVLGLMDCISDNNIYTFSLVRILSDERGKHFGWNDLIPVPAVIQVAHSLICRDKSFKKALLQRAYM